MRMGRRSGPAPTAVGMRSARVNIDTDWNRSNCRTHRNSCSKHHRRRRPLQLPLPPRRIRIRIRDNTLGPRPGSPDDRDDRQWDIRDEPGGRRWDVKDAAHHDSRHRGNVRRACRHRHGTRPREIRRRHRGSRRLRHGERRHHRGSSLRSAERMQLVQREDSEHDNYLPMNSPDTESCGTLQVDV
jgi:hypothetical protein